MTYVRLAAAIAICAAIVQSTAIGPPRLLAADAPGKQPTTIEFNRDIRPILADNCYQCHGPDKAQRKADLRLDVETAPDLRGARDVLVAGDPDQSELLQRLSTDDEDEHMPPVKSGKTLTPAQIELFRHWIKQGAQWQKHWAFLPPAAAAPPKVENQAWVRNPIDAFILDRLERERLAPAPPADKLTLIRRVSLDLTGLPPSPAEVDAFLADESPAAYERVVDRMLNSPRFGERMAVRWLDGGRYADTNGYQSDGERSMWRWRDWVIDAYNSNMPFDRFTIEQIAGDMLPDATLDQQIASGFNRNHRGNAEGGIIPEEYAAEYVVDRVDTTFTVWLGLTMGCTRCHDHKFDPITQKEFYQVFAYFNNVPEFGRAVKYGNSPPLIPTPTRQQQQQLNELDARLNDEQTAFDRLLPQVIMGQAQWEKTLDPQALTDWTITHGQQAYVPLDESVAGEVPVAIAARWENGEPTYQSGKIGAAGSFDGTRFVSAGDVGNFGFTDKFSLAAWVLPGSLERGTIVSRMTDAENADGYYVAIQNGHVQVNLVKRWLDDALRVETETPLAADAWQHVLVTYDGSRGPAGVAVYVDGRPQKLKVVLDALNQTFASKEPFRVGGGNGPQGRFRGLIDDVRIYAEVLTPDEAQILATAEPVGDLRSIPLDRRTAAQSLKLRACFLDRGAAPPIRAAQDHLTALRKLRTQLLESVPTTMVMQEMPVPRDTFVLIRGEYDKPGDKVAPAVPACLQPLPPGAAANRIGLARWLVDRANPLTARVAVNRLWQMVFGTGLVKTVDDFGAQGEWPSHPELLDWLAVELMSDPSASPRAGKSHAWDVKAMLRLIVTSATYQQSSRSTPALRQRDPDNRLLARGPRLRLSAEMVRDQALYAGGLLVEKLGGPSVKPYQPAGLWTELADTEYVQDKGEGLYRRSMYTYFKRTVAPPSLMTFDAAGRETCIVRETRTNTPLQALTLMNDVTFIEAARGLAQRVMAAEAKNPAERIALAFRLTTSRQPRPQELEILVAGFQAQLDRFAKSPGAADQLTAIGELRRPMHVDLAQLASYTTIAGVILNLDETITKE